MRWGRCCAMIGAVCDVSASTNAMCECHACARLIRLRERQDAGYGFREPPSIDARRANRYGTFARLSLDVETART